MNVVFVEVNVVETPGCDFELGPSKENLPIMTFCHLCSKKSTKNRTIDVVTKTCSDCQKSGSNAGAPTGATAQGLPNIDDDATLNTIKFSEYKSWMQAQFLPLHEDIKLLKEKMEEIEKQKKQIVLLQQRCDAHEETIDALKGIISKQQRSLRSQDAHVRSKNLIITGIPESDITDRNGTYKNDVEKVTALCAQVGTVPPEGFTVERLGEPNDKYPRSIKCNVISKENRTDIAKKSKELKDCQDPWNNVYINYDLHPADVEENKRLRKKKKALKAKEENKDKEIKIEKGSLFVDGIIVDSNILFQ